MNSISRLIHLRYYYNHFSKKINATPHHFFSSIHRSDMVVSNKSLNFRPMTIIQVRKFSNEVPDSKSLPLACIDDESLDQSSNVAPPEDLICSEKALETPNQATKTDETALKIEGLRGHLSDQILDQISDAAKEYDISNNLRLAHFLAQCHHESKGFKVTVENLNYSAEGLKNTFPKYFPDDLADSYARQPVKIGSHVYASRNGNGNEASEEGYKYRGRGYVQLTGKSNYKAFGNFVGEDLEANPDLVATQYPLTSALFFFKSRNLWTICDKGSDDMIVTAVTKKINGKTNGLLERIKLFKKYYSYLVKK